MRARARFAGKPHHLQCSEIPNRDVVELVRLARVLGKDPAEIFAALARAIRR